MGNLRRPIKWWGIIGKVEQNVLDYFDVLKNSLALISILLQVGALYYSPGRRSNDALDCTEDEY